MSEWQSVNGVWSLCGSYRGVRGIRITPQRTLKMTRVRPGYRMICDRFGLNTTIPYYLRDTYIRSSLS